MVQGGKYVTKDMIDKIQEALKDSPVELEYLRLLVEEKNRHIKEKMLLSIMLQGVGNTLINSGSE